MQIDDKRDSEYIQFVMSGKEEEEEFFVRAITDYYGVAADELDLKEGNIYTVIQTSASGWWYAIDEDGIDGWIPSNYLDKLAENEQNELREKRRMETEKEANRQLKIESEIAAEMAKYENVMDDDEQNEHKNRNMNDDGSMALKNELIRKANNYAKRMDARERAKADPSNENARIELQKLETQQKLNKDKKIAIQKIRKKHLNTEHKESEENKNNNYSFKIKKAENESLKYRPKMYEEVTYEEMQLNDNYRPELKSIKLNPNMDINSYNSKSYQMWTVDQLLHYLVLNAETQNTFELKSIVGYLGKKAQIAHSIKEDIIMKNGLNILLNILRCDGDKDVAVSMSCCKAITIVCEMSSAITVQYPVEKNAVYYLTTAIRNSFRNPIFCYTAFNCICNFTHGNDIHRQFIVNDINNSQIIRYIIEGMHKFRYEENITKNTHCVKVQISACLALQNLAADEKGREIIGADGVEAVLDGFIAHVENNVVISAALGTLINLCASSNNALHFMLSDGINYLSTLLQNPDVPPKSRVTICRILRNIASEENTAIKLVVCPEINDVISSLFINANYASEIFYEVCKFMTTFLAHLPTSNSKYELMNDLCSHNLFNILMDALEMDYELDINTNQFISNINSEIACIINCYVTAANLELKALVMDPTFIPSKLVQPSSVTPSPQLSYYCCSIYFHTCDTAHAQKVLIENGALQWLLESKWYLNTTQVQSAINVSIIDSSISLACGVILKFLQSWYIENTAKKVVVGWNVTSAQPFIESFLLWITENRLNNKKEPPSQHLKDTCPKLQQFMAAVPALLKKFN